MSEKISAMPSHGPLMGDELLVLVQDGINVNCSLFDAITFAGFFFADATFYASPTGNDLNNGLTPGTPKTLQGALNMVSAGTIGDGVTITIQMLDGFYTPPGAGGWVLPYFYGPFGTAILQGNSSNRNAVILSDTASVTDFNLLYTGAGGFYTWAIQNFIIQKPNNPSGFGGFLGLNGGTVSIRDGISFGANGPGNGCNHIIVNNGSRCSFDTSGTNSIYIGSSAPNFIQCLGTNAVGYMVGGFSFDCVGGTRVFSDAFYRGELLAESIIFAFTGAFPVVNGSITGVRGTFVANAAGKFYNAPPTNVLPGNSPMTTASGGQII